MVGFVSLPVSMHDTFFCVGLGFFTALFYMLLRFLFGSTQKACFFCDVTAFLVGSIFYFAVSCQVLAVGVCRWYTALGVLAGHGLCCKLFLKNVLHGRKCCKRYLREAKHFFIDQKRKILCLMARVFAKKHKKHLQNTTKVLYNSNNLYGDEPFSSKVGKRSCKKRSVKKEQKWEQSS